MIAILAIRIGMQAGLPQRNLGVVDMCRKAVPSLTIVTQVFPTGALVGPLVSRRGVAAVTNWAVLPKSRLTLTATQDILTGNRAGRSQKYLGVASMNRRVAQTRHRHSTAMLDILIGRTGGRSPKDLGAASMNKRLAWTCRCHLTAMPDILIGSLDGPLRRRLGVVSIPPRHAVTLSLASDRTG